jgi:hypothetical protein
VAVTCGTPRPRTPRAGAGRARPDADEHAGHAVFHQFEHDVVGDGVADDDRDFLALVKSARSSDLYSVEMCLTVETVDWTTKRSAPGFLRDGGEALGLLRDGTDGGEHAALAQFLHAPGDQFLLDRLGVNFLDLLGDVFLVGLDDLASTSSGLS